MPTDVIDPLETQEPPKAPGLGVVGGLRWMWRQLTSMRTALFLLFLLAVAAVPGSVLPQRGVSPLRVREYFDENPTLAPIFDNLSLFDVYASPWFAAIYLLLLISLTGCIIPRCLHYARSLGTRPPRTPRNLARLPVHRSIEVQDTEAQALDAAHRALRANGFRVQRFDDDHSVSAEKGYLHEFGNLAFHLALFVILIGVAWGSLFGYRGTVVVVEGQGFSNILTQYDDFTPGRRFDQSMLAPFSFMLDDFEADFLDEGPRRGQPADFRAQVSYRNDPQAEQQSTLVSVNKPLAVDGAKLFLLGHGYAPAFTVRDGAGDVVYSGAIASLPQDPLFTSKTAVKVPDASPEQLGFNVTVTPTAPDQVDPITGPRSVFPEMDDPRVYLGGWAGDLGLDDGVAQNVYELDTTDMKQFGIKNLGPGDTWQLPGGRGSITFDGLKQFGNFQIAHDPGGPLVLAGAIVAIAGVMASLLIKRRRVWVRVRPLAAGRTLVEFAGLARSEASGLVAEVDRVVESATRHALDQKE